MYNSNFETLLALVTHDHAMHGLQRSMQVHVQQKADIQKMIDQLQIQIQVAKGAGHDVLKDVYQAECDLEALYVKEDLVQKQLNSAQDFKQYQALTKELQVLQQEKDKQEQALMHITNKKSYHEKQAVQLESEFAAQSKDLFEKIQNVEKELSDLQVQYEKAKQEREEKIKTVPQEWMEMYTSMSATVHNPIVSIMNESCGGCFYPITKVLLQQAAKNKLVQCQNCCRIMYIPQ